MTQVSEIAIDWQPGARIPDAGKQHGGLAPVQVYHRAFEHRAVHPIYEPAISIEALLAFAVRQLQAESDVEDLVADAVLARQRWRCSTTQLSEETIDVSLVAGEQYFEALALGRRRPRHLLPMYRPMNVWLALK